VVLRGLIVIVIVVIVIDGVDWRALTDFYRLRWGDILWSGEKFVPLHCQKRERLRAAVNGKNR
jgi:hypothetical protein